MAEYTTNTPETEEEHRNFTGIMIEFWLEWIGFLKYILYDVFLGR